MAGTDRGSPLIGGAHAADFTGRVKRIRIRKKRVDSGFKMAAVALL